MDTPNPDPIAAPSVVNKALPVITDQKAAREIELARIKAAQGSLRLVFVMLSILAGLSVVILILPMFARLVPGVEPEKFIEFSKWALAVMLGAFGAWIGAGAAYFFGKENLAESSRSTEQALRIQQEALKPKPVELIRDMPLTAMNPAFVFTLADTKKAVVDKLEKLRGFWFVPVVDEHGALKDVIHARVFWQPDPPPETPKTPADTSPKTPADTPLSSIIEQLNKAGSPNDLHGGTFYTTVSLNDKVMDVYETLKQKNVEVIIVVDNGKPVSCISKTDLTSFLKCAKRI